MLLLLSIKCKMSAVNRYIRCKRTGKGNFLTAILVKINRDRGFNNASSLNFALNATKYTQFLIVFLFFEIVILIYLECVQCIFILQISLCYFYN